MIREILQGDALEQLRGLPSECVDCVVTSPPYWALRDYGAEGQIGLEGSWREHLARLLPIFAEVHRVLTPMGSLWVNYGDTVSTGAGGSRGPGGKRPSGRVEAQQPANAPNRLSREDPRKHKLGLAWRLRFLLNDELGFISRGDIVWHKPNAMPLSVKDRVTPKYEMLFHFVKQPTYYFDLDAIRAPLAEATISRLTQATFHEQTGGPKDYGGNMSIRRTMENLRRRLEHDSVEARRARGTKKGTPPGQAPQSFARSTKQGEIRGFDSRSEPDGKGVPPGQRARPSHRFNIRVRDAQKGRLERKWGALASATPEEIEAYEEGWSPNVEMALGANPGDVWTIPNAPFKDAHFATFPPELPRRCILASCPREVCTQCGTPKRRVTRKTAHGRKREDRGGLGDGHRRESQGLAPVERAPWQEGVAYHTVGWAAGCKCNAPFRAGLVLDPFAGAFTTCLVAAEEGRGFIGIELNPAYVAIGKRRLANYRRPITNFPQEPESSAINPIEPAGVPST